MIYAILTVDGKCVNRILWDGKSDWQPPEGCIAVPDPDSIYAVESDIQPQPQPQPQNIVADLTEEQKAALLALLTEQS